MNRENNTGFKIKRLTAVAMFCALAYVCTLVIHPPVQFLTLDVKDALIVLAALLFGPTAGIVIALIVPLLEFLTISSTGVYGLIMNVLSSLTFSVVTGVIYRYKRTISGAVIGLVSAVFSVTAVMLVANIFITPHFMGVPTETVLALIPTLLLPFNLVKAVLNAAIVLLLYKPLSKTLRRIGFLQSTGGGASGAAVGKGRSVLVSTIAVVMIAASLAVVFWVLA